MLWACCGSSMLEDPPWDPQYDRFSYTHTQHYVVFSQPIIYQKKSVSQSYGCGWWGCACTLRVKWVILCVFSPLPSSHEKTPRRWGSKSLFFPPPSKTPADNNPQPFPKDFLGPGLIIIGTIMSSSGGMNLRIWRFCANFDFASFDIDGKRIDHRSWMSISLGLEMYWKLSNTQAFTSIIKLLVNKPQYLTFPCQKWICILNRFREVPYQGGFSETLS